MTLRATTLVTPPVIEPITLDEALEAARITADDGANDTIERLIGVARDHAESRTGRQLVEATRKWLLDGFPALFEIKIPRAPLQSVTTVRYRDAAGDWQTMVEGTDYIVDTEQGGTSPEEVSGIGRIYLPAGVTWPDTYDDDNTVEIIFVCGYPVTDGVSTTPKTIKAAMGFYIADAYDGVPFRDHVKWMLGKYKTAFRF